MWPHPDILASKIKAVISNMKAGKNWMEGIKHKDMSESEPEPEVHELPNPKSSFVIPKVPRRTRPKKEVSY